MKKWTPLLRKINKFVHVQWGEPACYNTAGCGRDKSNTGKLMHFLVVLLESWMHFKSRGPLKSWGIYNQKPRHKLAMSPAEVEHDGFDILHVGELVVLVQVGHPDCRTGVLTDL